MVRRGLRAHMDAVDKAVAVNNVSGCRINRLFAEVRVMVDVGLGAFVWDERGDRGRGVNEPMMLNVSPIRMSV